MTLKGKVYFVILMPLEFIGLLLVLGFIATSSLQAADNASEPETLLSATGLEQHTLTLVSVSPLIVEGTTLGELLVYDDPTTKRPADYFELYDRDADLLAVGWFDRFGIKDSRRPRASRGRRQTRRGLCSSFRRRFSMTFQNADDRRKADHKNRNLRNRKLFVNTGVKLSSRKSFARGRRARYCQH